MNCRSFIASQLAKDMEVDSEDWLTLIYLLVPLLVAETSQQL